MKYFQNLQLEENYDLYFDIDGREIWVMLFLALPSINQKLDALLDNLQSFAKLCLSAIQEEYHAEDSTVRKYLQMHLEECPAEEIAKFVTQPEGDREAQLMEKFAFKGLSIFPSDEDITARFDFMPFVGDDFLYTDEVICVETDHEGHILDIMHES